MTNPIIETDLAQILLEIKSDIKSLDSKFEQRFDKVDERLNKIEIGQADIKGDIKALDTKTEQLDKRIGNVEFANRGILIGLVVVIFGGVVKLFGAGN
jgi:hypothetical protein